jgi:formate hydrogenlyase transcriptional activator
MSITTQLGSSGADKNIGPMFEQIIGQSNALESVLKAIELVAPTNSTVLIQGETGTGKELLARAVHKISPRCNQPFVVVNCASIPADLLESELFGYERGAFTGAVNQKIGRFETAHRGTLFLDEVGELSPEIQPKLLRFLQEQEFERLGGRQTHRVDVRVVAATNRNLSNMVELGTFRSELFYRLSVFPVNVPPLRERPEDIALLIRYFVDRFSRRIGRTIDTIPEDTFASLLAYPWPGNIRELQNFIERAVIVSTSGVLRNPFELNGSVDLAKTREPMTLQRSLDAAERTLILKALARTNWIVGGAGGAASMLGLKRTGLLYKMRRLGIARVKRETESTDSTVGIIDHKGQYGEGTSSLRLM